ncbi:sensor histidine kinase [Kribbella deserti]|uniref:histidine kinase n=1 Tax=Kribbella deserti TaxID=1926257 RepID=A0ABV6QGW7_9ACTN
MTSTQPESRRQQLRRLWMPLAVGVVQVAGSFGAYRGQADRREPDLLMVLLALIGPIALYWLRRRPVVVLTAVTVSTLAYMLLQYPYGPIILSFVIAVFSVVIAGHRLAGWIATAGLYCGHVLGRMVLGINEDGVYQSLAVGAWFVVMVVVAELVRNGRERSAAVARTRKQEELRRAGEERLRIAQELHDVVAHHISLINVQAGVALHLVDRQPEQAGTALAAIKEASKEALVELRSIVGVLRQSDESAPRQPVPGLERLGQLLNRTSGAGLEVQQTTAGAPHPLPTSVERAAFRIIQESLTNVVRHSGATSVQVHLQYGGTAFEVRVDDNGRGVPETVVEGNGLVGMRERATALGGSLSITRSPSGGFRVTAQFPITAADERDPD